MANDLPTPAPNLEKFAAKAAGMDIETPTPVTNMEKYLDAIAKRGESIGNIGDVEIDNPENGEVMKYDAEQGKWINGTASGGGGTSDYTDLTNKPKINNVTLAGNKSLSDIGAADASETYTETEVDTLLAGKVDKVDGKGLSTEDFTTEEKTKLSGIASGAEVNAQSDWAQTDTDADDYIKNKPTTPAIGTCTTAGSVADKVVTMPQGWTLHEGAVIAVRFSYSHSSSVDNVTLNVGGSGAKSIYYSGAVYTSHQKQVCGYGNHYIYYVYDGTYWAWIGWDFMPDTGTMTQAQIDAGTDTVGRLITAKLICDNFAKITYLGTAAAKGVDSSPTTSSTNLVESGGVASALAGKQATLTTAQQNAANSGITAAKVAGLAEAINAGAKNVLLIKNYTPGQTYTNGGRTFTFLADGGVKITGDATVTGNVDCYLSGSWTDTSKALELGGKDHTVVLRSAASLASMQLCVYNRSTGSTVSSIRVGTNDTDGEVINFDATTVFLSIGSSVTLPTDGIVVYPMICPKALFDASPDFAQYAPTNRELYEMILALQAGT